MWKLAPCRLMILGHHCCVFLTTEEQIPRQSGPGNRPGHFLLPGEGGAWSWPRPDGQAGPTCAVTQDLIGNDSAGGSLTVVAGLEVP